MKIRLVIHTVDHGTWTGDANEVTEEERVAALEAVKDAHSLTYLSLIIDGDEVIFPANVIRSSVLIVERVKEES